MAPQTRPATTHTHTLSLLSSGPSFPLGFPFQDTYGELPLQDALDPLVTRLSSLPRAPCPARSSGPGLTRRGPSTPHTDKKPASVGATFETTFYQYHRRPERSLGWALELASYRKAGRKGGRKGEKGTLQPRSRLSYGNERASPLLRVPALPPGLSSREPPPPRPGSRRSRSAPGPLSAGTRPGAPLCPAGRLSA